MENIKVVVRLRPFSTTEIDSSLQNGWKTDRANNMIECVKSSLYDRPFFFDRIFTGETTTQELYSDCVKDLINEAFNGIDTTVFAYGQTGAGKTYSILGQNNNQFDFEGIAFIALDQIFKRILSKSENEEFVVTCSYIEIYNEQVYDLLNKPENFGECLQIYEDQKQSKFKVVGNTKVRVETIEEVKKILIYGETNRTYGETCFNLKSSRSHTILTINLKFNTFSNGEMLMAKESTINVVDLAGNERLMFDQKIKGNMFLPTETSTDQPVKRSTSTLKSKQTANMDFKANNNQESRIAESKNINKSLFFLTQIIYLCAKKNQIKHIPFRNSSLTKILRSSFGGTSRTLLILCLSPTMSDIEVSLSTLRFGKCAKKIENTIKPNVVTQAQQNHLQGIVDAYEQKLVIVQNQVEKMSRTKKIIPDISNFMRELRIFIANQSIEERLKDISHDHKHSFAHTLAGNEKYSEVLNKLTGILVFRRDKHNSLVDQKSLISALICPQCKFQKEVNFKNMIGKKELISLFESKFNLQGQFETNAIDYIDQISAMYEVWRDHTDKLLAKTTDFEREVEVFVKSITEEVKDLHLRLDFYENLDGLSDWTDEELQEKYTSFNRKAKLCKREVMRRMVCSKLGIEDPEKTGKIKETPQKAKEEEKDEEIQEKLGLSKFLSDFKNVTEEIQITQEMLREEVNLNFIFEQAKVEITNQSNELKQSNLTLKKSLEMFTNEMDRRMNEMKHEIIWMTKFQKNEVKTENPVETGPFTLKQNNSLPIFEIVKKKKNQNYKKNEDYVTKLKPLIEHAISLSKFCKSAAKVNDICTSKVQVEDFLAKNKNMDKSVDDNLDRKSIESSQSPDKYSDIDRTHDNNGWISSQTIAEKVQMFKESSNQPQLNNEIEKRSSKTQDPDKKVAVQPRNDQKPKASVTPGSKERKQSDMLPVNQKKGVIERLIEKKREEQLVNQEANQDDLIQSEKEYLSLNSSGFIEEEAPKNFVIKKEIDVPLKMASKEEIRDTSNAKKSVKKEVESQKKNEVLKRRTNSPMPKEKQKNVGYANLKTRK